MSRNLEGMQGNEYIMTNDLMRGEILFKYDLNGILQEVIFKGGITENQYRWIGNNLPYREELIKEWKRYKDLRVDQVLTDLSFERFWNDYGYKVGKRKMAERIWSLMSVADKIKALIYIPRYRDHLKRKGLDQAYPTTYLNQRYFEG